MTAAVLATAQLAGAGTLSERLARHRHNVDIWNKYHQHHQQQTSNAHIPVKASVKVPVNRGVGTMNTAGTAAPGEATGDSRNVSEPKVPSTVCTTVTAYLGMTNRTTDNSHESNPPDTHRIQQALDSCTRTSGQVAVELKAADSAHRAFLAGPLTVHQGEVLLIDSGVTLYASRNPAVYQRPGGPTCGTVQAKYGGCLPLIEVYGANAGVEGARGPNGSQGRIDGRGDQRVLGTNATWWQLATEAGQKHQNQNNPDLIEADNSNNFTLYDIDLLNSPHFHASYVKGDGFTAWGVRIKTPANARNTDGIDPMASSDVTIANSSIQDGDDGIAIKAQQASKNITIENNHFYGTHGISIGGETNGGLTNVLLKNNTIQGTDSSGILSTGNDGIRIKSSPQYGGNVSDVTYLNTCIRGVSTPLDFITRYGDSSYDQSYSGSGGTIPSYTGIVVDGLAITGSPSGTQSVFDGYDPNHPLGATLRNVSADTTAAAAANARITVFNSDIRPTGNGVNLTSGSGSGGTIPSCTFPAYPAL